jgi:hypothetical protein
MLTCFGRSSYRAGLGHLVGSVTSLSLLLLPPTMLRVSVNLVYLSLSTAP